MPRNIPANILDSLNQTHASEPLPVVEILLNSGTRRYSYKEFGDYDGELLSITPVTSQGDQSITARLASVNITIDDTNGEMYQYLCTEDIQFISAKVYLQYPSIDHVDALLLMTGRIQSRITWSEGDRTLQLTIDSFDPANEVGYAPEEGDFTDLHPDAIGKAWPLCFGSVLRVPAVRVIKPDTGELSGTIDNVTEIFTVDGGSRFLQDTATTITVGNVKMHGIFTSDQFTVTSSPVADFTTPINIADRGSDTDVSVFWLSDASINLRGKYIKVTQDGETYTNRVLQQIGAKCYMANAMPDDVLLTAGGQVAEAAGVALESWFIDDTTQHALDINLIPDSDSEWTITDGAYIESWRTSVNYNVYIANLLPASTIYQVIGKRNYKNKEVYTPIPSSYYSILSSGECVTLLGRNCTALRFNTSLESIEGEGWTGDVYVSLRSSQPTTVAPETNTARIIQYLISTYATDLSVDSTSFNTVAGYIKYYPSNFMYNKVEPVLTLCAKIAWQARCALYIENNVVYIKYLSREPAPDHTVRANHIHEKTLNITMDDNNIATRLISKWVHNYTGENDSTHEYIAKNNISRYGLHSREIDFFIYTNLQLVTLSTNFWLYRYSHIWKHMRCELFLSKAGVQHFDCIEENIDTLGDFSIKGVVEEFSIDLDSPFVKIDVELACQSGTSIEDPLYWTAGIIPVSMEIPADPVTGLTIENDDTVIGDDSDRHYTQTPDKDKEIRYVVWKCYPLFTAPGEPFSYTIGIYDKPNPTPDDQPLKESVKVRIEPTTVNRGSILINRMNVFYIDITNGLYTGTFTVNTTLTASTVWLKACVVRHGLDKNGEFKDKGRDVSYRPSRVGPIALVRTVDLPEWGRTQISITAPAEVTRGVPFQITVETRAETTFTIELNGATDANDTLTNVHGDGASKETTPKSGSVSFYAMIIGGKGDASTKLRVYYNNSNCDPEHIIEALSDTITIKDKTEEEYTSPSGDPSSGSRYNPELNPDVDNHETKPLVQIRYDYSNTKKLEYRTRGVRYVNGRFVITDYGTWEEAGTRGWEEIFTAQPCP